MSAWEHRCCAPDSDALAAAGDASPFLDRETYGTLSFEPPYSALPTREQYLGSGVTTRYPIRSCDLIWMDGAGSARC